MIRQLKYGLTQLFLLAYKKYLKASLPLASVSNLFYPLSGLKLVVFLQNGLIKRRTRLDERNRVDKNLEIVQALVSQNFKWVSKGSTN